MIISCYNGSGRKKKKKKISKTLIHASTVKNVPVPCIIVITGRACRKKKKKTEMKFNVITTPRRTYVKADSRDDYYYNYTTFSRRFFVIFFFLNWVSNFYPVPSGWAPDARPDASRPVSRAHVRR